jgi:hypothetical protein
MCAGYNGAAEAHNPSQSAYGLLNETVTVFPLSEPTTELTCS